MSSEPLAASHADDHAVQTEHHPGARTYINIGIILFVLTVLEVAAVYIEVIYKTPVLLLGTLFGLMIVKFTLVVMFFMHLKYDNRLFTWLFTAPLFVAVFIVLALMALFGAYHLGTLIDHWGTGAGH
jgi:cytochrome c oxidase subunit 4